MPSGEKESLKKGHLKCQNNRGVNDIHQKGKCPKFEKGFQKIYLTTSHSYFWY